MSILHGRRHHAIAEVYSYIIVQQCGRQLPEPHDDDFDDDEEDVPF